MKKAYVILIGSLFLFSIHVYSQANSKMNWISKDYMPGNIPAFEENKGQFPVSAKGWKILYGCNYEGVEIFLTDKGIIYNISKREKDEGDLKNEEKDADKEAGKKEKVTYQHIFIEWESRNESGTSVEARDETPYYFCEGKLEHPKETVTNIRGFQKVVYHDLYPGTDLEFSFHKGNGIEYAIKVKPGFDAGVFKMHYTGDSGLSFDSSHNLHIRTIAGDIIEHKPVVTSGVTWTVFPVTVATYACDVGMDGANNAYILEYSYPSLNALIMYAQKYNTTGVLQWTYTLNEFTTTPFNPVEIDSASCSPFIFSDFAVDANGNAYIAAPFGFYNPFTSSACSGACPTYGMVCLNTLGKRNYLDYSYSADSIVDTWNIAYSCADSLLIEGGSAFEYNKLDFDGVNTATGNPNPGEYVNVNVGEIYAGTIAPNGNYYALTAASKSSFADQLISCQVTKTKTSLTWQLPTAYTYTDEVFKETPQQVGSNGIAAGCSYLYTSDGLELSKRDLTTGNVDTTITIPGGSNTAATVNSGIAVDLLCGNVYVGSNNVIYIYDQNLRSRGSFTGLPGKVNDVKYSNGLITACGDNGSNQGFVVQMNALSCGTNLTITPVRTGCSKSDGNATAYASFCTSPYYYLWSPSGQTTQTATGLSAGTYTVNVTPHGTCLTIIDSVIINDSILTPSIAASKDSICLKDTSILYGYGNPGTTFKWSPGGSTSKTIHVIPNSTTVYTLYIYEGDCVDSAEKKIKIIPAIIATVKASPDSICPLGIDTLTVKATGGQATYKWSTGATTASIRVKPAVNTQYIATVYGLCDTVHDTITVKVIALPKPVITGLLQECSGSGDTLAVSGGTAWLWNNGSTANQYIIDTLTGNTTVSVKVYNGKCYMDTAIKISVTQPPAVVVCIAPVSNCKILTALANDTGDTFQWSNGATTDTTTVCPNTPASYTVTVSNGCITKKITYVPVVYTPPLKVCCDTIINGGGTAQLLATGDSLYKWTPSAGVNCDTCPRVNVTPSVTTTYTVTGTDSNGCTHIKTITVEVLCSDITVPTVFTPNNDGQNDQLVIKTIDLDSYSIVIYDRWGREQYKSSNPLVYWDGDTESGAKHPMGCIIISSPHYARAKTTTSMDLWLDTMKLELGIKNS